MDDNSQFWDKRISSETRRALRTLSNVSFYTDLLEHLDQGFEEDTAFGFKFFLAGGLVRARPAKPFA